MTTDNPTQHTAATAELQATPSVITTTINVPDQFVQALKEGQSIMAAEMALGGALVGDGGAVVALPKDFDIHDLEAQKPNRRRARGAMSTAYVTPFAQYAIAYRQPGAAVFVDASTMQARAVLDLGTLESPGHADNTAELKPIKTAAFDALLQLNGRARGQQELAEFIEDWGIVARLQFFREAEEVTLPKALAAIRSITIESARKQDSEVQQLSASRTAFESVQATSANPIPTLIYYTTKPYADLEERTFVLRLSILTGEKAPMLVLRIQNLEAHTEAMGNELAELVRTAIKGEMPVLLGSYRKAE
ncbi:DUF2303 family protein [Acidovorax sp. BL-A-41-H1]|uniref:DUF2303 family protein n=1 Tax=Acidovorax sp. BL-A-41-H1 TaxID=3421102 RepID=UPI003F79303F